MAARILSTPFIQQFAKSHAFQVAKIDAFKLTRQVPKLALWGFPGVITAAWLVYPALTEAYKAEVGLPSTAVATNFPKVQWEHTDDEIDTAPVRKE